MISLLTGPEGTLAKWTYTDNVDRRSGLTGLLRFVLLGNILMFYSYHSYSYNNNTKWDYSVITFYGKKVKVKENKRLTVLDSRKI